MNANIMQYNILIDQEFQALLDPLEAVERAQLEANIVADGCRDPLVLWGELLIDGHNRYEICTRLGLPFNTVQMVFADRDAAMDWIDANQMGKRNMSPEAFTRALGRRYNRAKKIQGGTGANQHVEQTGQNVQSANTAQSLAAAHNVNERTVRRAGDYDTAAGVIEAAGGSVSGAKQQDVVQAAKVVADLPALADDVPLAAQVASLPVAEQAIVAAAPADEIKEVAREVLKNHRALGTGENEWYTPAEYADLAREVMGGIDLDPASCEQANKVIGADTFYSKDDDGLSKDWTGRVWLNPPYSRDLMPAFVEKLKASFIDGSVEQAVLVSHNNTDTAWFHNLASAASAICFPKKRIRFYRDEEIAAPTNGQAFFYLGESPEKFISVFSDIGFVVRPV